MIGWLSIARKLLVTGALIASVADAQTSGGVFRGEVRDPSSAIVPQAKVVIRSNDNGMQVIAESNGDGLYVTPTVIPGSYTLSATKPGFETEVFGPVTVQVNQTVRVDFALKHRARLPTRCTWRPPERSYFRPESAEVSQVIVSKQVSEIPLNGRNWQQLIDLSAGVNPGAPGESGSPNPVNINGQRTKANLYLVDGVSTTSSTEGRGNNFNIPLDAVREFSVQAGSYSAEFGDVAGGVINLQSKSGTNNWHGSLFEFFRNDKLDAVELLLQPDRPAQECSSIQPVRRIGRRPHPAQQDVLLRRLPGHRRAQRPAMVTTVPFSDQRGGDFSGLHGPGAGPDLQSVRSNSLRAPVSEQHRIPASLLDPAAVKISALATATKSIRRWPAIRCRSTTTR